MLAIRGRVRIPCALAVLGFAAGCSDSDSDGDGGGRATLSGTVLGPSLAGLPGAVVEVIPLTALVGGGSAKQAVTDAAGNFIVLGTPTGAVHVHIDGSNVPGGTFASLELALTIGGGNAILPQPVVLPDLDAGVSLDVAVDAGGITTNDETLGDPLIDGFALEIPAGTVITVDGSAPVGSVPVNITPVPAIDVPMPLPDGLAGGAFVTIQPPGALFAPALSITLPNPQALPVDALVDIWSFDHGLAQWVNRSQETGNQGVVTDIGGTSFIVASAVITEGGWHSGVIDVDPGCATTIAGQVFIEGSSAVPLANVLISLSTGQFDTTGIDGRFSIPSVPAYAAALLPELCMPTGLELRALGPVSHGASLVQVLIDAQIVETGGTTNVPALDLPVSLTGSLVGSVVDAAGAPADGTVTITGPENLALETSGGAFFASALAPGSYTASFTFASQLTALESFGIAANQLTSVDLVEPGGSGGEGTIVVRVVDLTVEGVTGNVPQACVTLVGANGAPLFRVADAVGIAEFEDAPAGPYTVTAQLETPLVPSGTLRSATTVVGVNALGTPSTILVPFFATGATLPPVTTDAMLQGTVQNVPAGVDLDYQIAEGVSGFFDSGPADTGFLAAIPSGRALDVGVIARDSTTDQIVSGIFVADAQATPGLTLMLDFDFANAHPFERQVDMTYTNPQGHPTAIAELALGDLALDVRTGFSLPDPLGMPDLSRAKFVDLPAVLVFGTEDGTGLSFEDSFCDQPLDLVTPTLLTVPFLTPPAIVSPANNADFPGYGTGSMVSFVLGPGTGSGPGFNGISFFHQSKPNQLFTFWDILVSPATTMLTLPPVFPAKPMFAQGFAAVNVDTPRFASFPGFSFANFFDVNLPANVAAVLSDRICAASRSHFFTVGLPLRSAPPREFLRRVERQPRRFE